MGNTNSNQHQQLKGKRIAFTGFRDPVLTKIIEAAGCHVMTNVSMTTDLLVHSGYAPSAKAKKWAKRGVAIIQLWRFAEEWMTAAQKKAYRNVVDKKTGPVLSGHFFETHDNGGRAFQVIVNTSKKRFSVYERMKNDVIEEPMFATLTVKPTAFLKYWIGKDSKDNDGAAFGHGNSMLFQLTKKKYMFVGRYVFTFESEQIISYHSPIGGSDVPYPYAIGENNTYLMIEQVYVPNHSQKNKDPYDDYYTNKTTKSNAFKKFRSTMIRKRLDY